MSTPLKSEVLPSGKLQFGLARFNDVYFLIATRCLGMLQGCSRITHKLNETRGFNEPVRMLWLNCDSGNGENSDALMSPFNILLNADPPVFVPTGRRRKEISAENGDEIDCPEFELVIREDQLFRQCYYCLGWDDDWDRLLKMEGDYYWCNSCSRLGRVHAYNKRMLYEKIGMIKWNPYSIYNMSYHPMPRV